MPSPSDQCVQGRESEREKKIDMMLSGAGKTDSLYVNVGKKDGYPGHRASCPLPLVHISC